MLYYLHYLETLFSPLRVFRYITVRAVAGAGTAFILSLVVGPWLIRKLQGMNVSHGGREEVDQLREARDKQAAARGHAPGSGSAKKTTPTMGGVLIIGTMVLSSILWANPGTSFIWLVLGTTCYMGLIGFCDDYQKVSRRGWSGLDAKSKLVLQGAWALIVVLLLLLLPETRDSARRLMVPFLKRPLLPDIGVFGTFLFAAAVLIGATNAVNLTDGLDGLAIGCSSSVALSYLVMSYVAGHAAFADYLNIPFIRGAGELTVLCGCLMGSCLGFLWHNCHPARIFMGDTGSLALGGAIAMIAILIKQELVLIIVGGVFVVEAVSVIIQVASFKTRGKRVFAMAPLHHHFEHRGWSETQVVVRFWILSIICALMGVLTLKIR